MKTCKRCGKVFYNNGKYEKICIDCRKPKGFSKGAKRGDVHKCPVCGEEFTIKDYNRKYCSTDCFKKSKQR